MNLGGELRIVKKEKNLHTLKYKDTKGRREAFRWEGNVSMEARLTWGRFRPETPARNAKGGGGAPYCEKPSLRPENEKF